MTNERLVRLTRIKSDVGPPEFHPRFLSGWKMLFARAPSIFVTGQELPEVVTIFANSLRIVLQTPWRATPSLIVVLLFQHTQDSP